MRITGWPRLVVYNFFHQWWVSIKINGAHFHIPCHTCSLSTGDKIYSITWCEREESKDYCCMQFRKFLSVLLKARLEYDVHRHELEALRQQPNTSADSIGIAYQRCEAQREKYERLKEDVRVSCIYLKIVSYLEVEGELKLKCLKSFIWDDRK